MGYVSFLSLGLCALVLFHGCIAQQQPQWQFGGGQSQQQQQPRLRSKTDCQFERITASEPNRRLESEAGVTEFWDSNSDEFVCAGVDVSRNTIQRRGLLLPSYANAPQLIYIVQGRGIQGTVLPGCAETYESSSPRSDEQDRSERRSERSIDRHQKVFRFKEGDVLAVPAGVAHWAYNDGETPIISIALQDTSNYANQLDNNFRRFFLAGNPQQRGQQQEQERHQGKQQEQKRHQEQEGQSQQRGESQESGNIFNGFEEQILSEVFNLESATIRKLKGQEDQRGRIVRAERFEVVSPQWEERKQGRQERDNGLEETICSMKLRENIGNPARADVYNPRGGRLTHLNSQKLPVLSWLQLSAERGVLYKNAVLAPHWNWNAHSIIYITRGSSRIQIVGNNGKAVFDDEVREGQLVVVPQNFAVVRKAGNQGCEWIALKTNDNAITTQLAGKFSVIQSLPEDVIANSYGLSRDQARSLKNNRQEAVVFSPGSRSRDV